MSVSADLRTFLLADSALAALIGTRLHPLRLPQNPTLPAMTYQWVSGERAHALDGAVGLSSPRVQFDCWAGTYLQAEAVFEAFRKRLDGFRGDIGSTPTKVQGAFFESERDMYEDSADAGTGSGVGMYRRSADFFINFEEATA
jgi:hypothetical protein